LTIEQSILHRWALQAIAVRPNDPNEVVVLDMKDYTQKMRDRKLISTPPDELEAMLKRSTSMFLQFDDKDSLVSVLRQFTAYGGSKSLGFPSLSSFPVSVEDLVHTFYEAWERDGDDRARLNLAMELWAKSQRLTVNRLLESAADCK
jgi:hypothetical protein